MFDNVKQLTDKYPKLFPVKTIRGRSFTIHIECGTGWYYILDRMCSSIQNHIDNTRKGAADTLRYNRALKQAVAGNSNNLRFRYKKMSYDDNKIARLVSDDISANRPREIWRQAPKQIVFTQIKEKFGTLRVYTNFTDDYCDGVITMAESMSARTCEECAQPGKQTVEGWIKTLCEECEANE
jgi:hypothetical protein